MSVSMITLYTFGYRLFSMSNGQLNCHTIGILLTHFSLKMIGNGFLDSRSLSFPHDQFPFLLRFLFPIL